MSKWKDLIIKKMKVGRERVGKCPHCKEHIHVQRGYVLPKEARDIQLVFDEMTSDHFISRNIKPLIDLISRLTGYTKETIKEVVERRSAYTQTKD